MRVAFFLYLLPLLCACLPAQADATDLPPAHAETPHIQARLIADLAAVRPGDEIWLGIEQKIAPDWHTYWKNPGDSGITTRIAWDAPAGTDIGETQWPPPSRFSLGPVTNYGYGGEVTLLARARVPDDLPAGGRLPLGVTVDWLICREECIPEQVKLGLELPLRAMSAPGENAALIAAARAALPQAAAWPASFSVHGRELRLRFTDAAFQHTPPRAVWFYPDAWGRIDQSGEQFFRVDADGLVLAIPLGEVHTPTPLAGVLTLGEGDERQSYVVTATPAAGGADAPSPDIGFAAAAALAFLGGILLNLMPCVFPVLSIKALALLQHGGGQAARRHGLAYLAGVLASFALFAALLLLLRAGGESLGWGFQFQSPVFVATVATLMFAVGLNLSGVFEIGGAAGAGEGLTRHSGLAASFFTGALAVAVATPCTAPFMGVALAYALAQPAPALLAVFLALGCGLALPYLALSFWPALQKRLPQPGVWMLHLRQALAFPMYATVIWLVWVLARQGGADAVLRLASALLLLALAAWVYGKTRPAKPGWRGFGAGAALVLVAVDIALIATMASPQTGETERHWEAYRPEHLQTLLGEGKPVFINLTADWCITCLANEKTTLDRAETRVLLRRKGIVYLKGDWTNQDDDISALLARHGRRGVPLYLLYPRGDREPAQVLPQILTPALLARAFATVPDIAPASASPP
ncbi:MAG: thioredoxin family protein [Azoarcus sp.]|jgi:thiol:disulfide interchange protein DsbD|nr:thioredoxin family protein [Azoarcus sp.]